MKQNIFTILLMGGFFCAMPFASRGDASSEDQLIATLQSATASPNDKDKACVQLKLIATDKAVPALVALLSDEKLYNSARYVLEAMPSPKAGEALREALSTTSGSAKAGIINSLAIRHDADAVAGIGKSLSDADTKVAVASAEALGRIGGSAADKILEDSIASSTGAVHAAEIDGLLNSGRALLDAGKDSAALKLFQAIYNNEKSGFAREGAYYGMIFASGKQGVKLAVDAINNGDDASQAAALHAAAQLKGSDATKELAEAALKAKVPVQVALIQSFLQRNDPAALPAVAQLAASKDEYVRAAALGALGGLGDDSSVKLLAEKAALSKGADRAAARQSLLELNHGSVTKTMVAMLNPAMPDVEAELITAMGRRGDQSACPALMKVAKSGNDTERAAALQALGQLADAGQIPKLVQLVADSSTDDARSAAADTLTQVYQRMPNGGAKANVDTLVEEVTHGNTETRLALLPVCSVLVRDPVSEALLSALRDKDERIRDAGLRALCETRDPALLEQLINIAVGGTQPERQLGIRGVVRLMTQEEGVNFKNNTKLDALEKILKGQLDTGEKRLVLSGLATISDRRALILAAGFLDDAEVKAEAEQAVVKIAPSVMKGHPAEAGAALKRVIAVSSNDDTHKSARALLDKIK